MTNNKVSKQNAKGLGKEAALKKFVDSQPILNMLTTLAETGRSNFHEQGTWEICLCALILNIEPNCKTQRILEALPDHDRQLDEVDVLNTMAHLGYACCKSDADLEDIDGRLLPGLFLPGEGVPCIVLGRNPEGKIQFYDPISKLISNIPPSFDREGRVWFFQPYEEIKAATSRFVRKGSGYSWFRAMLGRFRGTFVQVMVTGILLNCIALSTPLFIMMVYDRVIASGTINTLPMLFIGALLMIAFEWKLRNIRSTGLSWLAGRLDNIVSNRIFSHLIGLSPQLIEGASVAAQIARIKTFEAVRDFFSGSVFLSLLEAPMVVLAVITIWLIAGPLVLVPLSMVFFYVVLFYFIRKNIKLSIRLAAKTSSARQKFTIEAFEKLDSIRQHGLRQKWQDKFRLLSGREMMAHFHLGWQSMVSETLAHTLTLIAAVATVGFGVHLIWAGAISSGALVATMILVWRVLTPFYSLCTMVPRLEQLRNSILQVNNLMDIETEAEEAKSFARLPVLKGEIGFFNVRFRPSDDADDLFSNLSFEIKAGELAIITGDNGTGKAAVLHLIKALYWPSDGVVRIDGFDIRQLDAPYLRQQIAYVPRRPSFFEGSVLENMRYSNPLANEDNVRKALEQADALYDVENLPEGIHTVIGSHGLTNLTSSLATRLSLARAYLHPSSILLIDELPNTLLSGTAGKKLKEYLARAKGKRTVIMCTYREDYMKMASSIVWLRGFFDPVAGSRDEVLSRLEQISGAAA